MPIATGQLIPSLYTNPGSDAYVGAGSTLTLTLDYIQKTILFNTAAGSVVTLPAATGSGNIYKFKTSVIVTSNHSGVATNGTDIMVGLIATSDSNTVTAYPSTVANANKSFRLNGTTTGGAGVGEWYEVEDVATGQWYVRGQSISTGTAATPFNSTAG
jgi:hypothetical protein